MGTEGTIKIFLADDHPLVRMGLRHGLNQKAGFVVIGEAADGFSTVEKIQADPPDVSLIDVDMPGLSGIGVIRILRKAFSKMKIIVLSTYNDDKYIRESMAAGADGYVLKNVGIDELEKIIKSYYYDEPCFSPYLVNLGMDFDRDAYKGESSRTQGLTIREKEVLQHLAAGKGNKEISGLLFISTETVKSHIKNIYRKLKVKNRVEAVQAAGKKNLLV